MWQIQARRKPHGKYWEPISVEHIKTLPDGSPTRQFQYETMTEAVSAFARFLKVERTLAHVVYRRMTGDVLYLDSCEVQIARVVDAVDVADLAEFRPDLPPLCPRGKHTFYGEPTLSSKCGACGRSIAEIAGVTL